MFKFIIPLLLSSAAHAGKLAEGLFGVKWGQTEEFPAPMDGCKHKPMKDAEWGCFKQIGDVRAEVVWGYEYGRVYLVALGAVGYSQCSTLMDTLTSAWGESIPLKSYATDKMADRGWKDGDAFAHWTWNQFSQKCQVGVISIPDKKYVDEQRKKAAAKGVEDL
jgi:hypothetical protein